MHEPKPGKVKPPVEPKMISVGIVLPEDGMKKVSVHFLREVELHSEAGRVTLPAGTLQLEMDGEEIRFHHPLQEFSLRKGFELLPCDSSASAAFEIEGIVAGRSFHWRKKLRQRFHGTLSVRTDAGSFLLVNEIPFEDYVACVISSEMGGDVPDAFARAQAVAARTWSQVFLQEKHPGQPFDVCNDDDCQRYQGATFLAESSVEAVQATAAQYLVDGEGCLLPAYYSKCCGGVSELPEYSMGFSVDGIVSVCDSERELDLDLRENESFERWYEQSAEDPQEYFCSLPAAEANHYLGKVDIGRDYFRWVEVVSSDGLLQRIQALVDNPRLEFLSEIEVKRRGVSGRVVEMELELKEASGRSEQLVVSGQYDIRALLHEDFLLSSAFFVSACERSPGGLIESFTLSGAGWGHGVGLCQIGGVQMALKGKSHEEILKHYFPKGSLRSCA